MFTHIIWHIFTQTRHWGILEERLTYTIWHICTQTQHWGASTLEEIFTHNLTSLHKHDTSVGNTKYKIQQIIATRFAHCLPQIIIVSSYLDFRHWQNLSGSVTNNGTFHSVLTLTHCLLLCMGPHNWQLLHWNIPRKPPTVPWAQKVHPLKFFKGCLVTQGAWSQL